MSYEVMVVDANALAMIAALRSLGRAGYKPHAVSSQSDALGFRSRYTYKIAIHPDYDSPDFIPWLRDYCTVNPIRAIVCGEELLHAIDDQYSEFIHLIPDAPPGEIRRLCLSKVRVWKHLRGNSATSTYLPRSGVLESAADVESFTASNSERAVFYLKMDKQHGRNSRALSRVVRIDGTDRLQGIANSSLVDYSVVSWQQHVSGLQVGVSLWRHNGEFRAENMVLGLHLYPYHAGNMSLRKTWWNEKILADAKTKLAALDWSGVAMMEYIWDPDTGDFWFIEMNPRFWGYLHLDLICGKDFPKWQMDAHFGQSAGGLGSPKASRTLRYAPGEVIHVGSRCLAPNIAFLQKAKSIIEFAILGVNPKVHADLWFSNDRLLYFRSWFRFIRELPTKILTMRRRLTETAKPR